MLFVRRFLALTSLCLVAAGSSAVAQDTPPTPLVLMALDELAETDPATARDRIDAALAEPGALDPLALFNLTRLRAEIDLREAPSAEVAAVLVQLGQFAARNRALVGEDPITFYARAADVFRAAGDFTSAREALGLVLEEQRAGGLPGDALAQTFDALAELSDEAKDTDGAAQFRAEADAARTAAPPTRSATDDGGFREVEVFYATDRARSQNTAPSTFYGSGRGTLELGVAKVSIPAVHSSGVLEAPRIWKLEFGPNAARHVVLRSVTPVEHAAFYDRLNTRLDDAETREAFVYVHGFNTRFEKAAKRAAQMAYDMNFPGVPILYSWPSRGSTFSYVADSAVVRLSGRRLSTFLDDLVAETGGATTIHLVAHSMGNRALTEALEHLALRNGIAPGDTPPFDQVVFAAPDVDAGLFAEMLPTLATTGRRLTLYASEQDRALATSRQIHGQAPRAGQGGTHILLDPAIDSVDMTDLGADMLAHNYYARASSALADMVALFWRNAEPEQRCGLEPREITPDAPPVWLYQPGACEDGAFVEVLAHLQRANVTDLTMAVDILAKTVLDPQLTQTLVPVVSRLLSD